MKKYAFICGTARSGTTALWRLVTAHDDVAIGVERYIVKALGSDFIGKDHFEKERFFDLQNGDTFMKSLDAYPYYKELRKRFEGCKLYGDKIPRLYERYDLLDRVFDIPKVLFIVRNLFDVASSYNKRVAGGKNWKKTRDAKVAVADWNKSVLQTLEHFSTSDILIVEFEGLFSGKANVQRIFDFLGLDYNAKVGAAYKELVGQGEKIKTERETWLSEEEKQYICLHGRFDAYRKLITLSQNEGKHVGARNTSTMIKPSSDGATVVTASEQAENQHQGLGKYQLADKEIVNYQYYELPSTGLLFRGPAPTRFTEGGYFACIGGAHTFGRFAEKPYSRLLSDATGIDCLNLGHGGGKPLFYLANPILIEYLNMAKFVIVQVPSARAIENSVFEPVSENNSFLRDKSLGKDAKPLFANHAYKQLLKKSPPELVDKVVRETRKRYSEEMSELLRLISVPKILLWFSRRTPDYKDNTKSVHDLFGDYPQLVNQSVIQDLIPLCDDYVEVVSSRGLPQKLINYATGKPINVFHLAKVPSQNDYYPSPEMHEIAFKKLLNLPLCVAHS